MKGAFRLARPHAGLLCAMLAGVAHAAHPLISEDTGTQGTGRLELELGTATTHVQGAPIHELDPQLSFGALDSLDLVLRPSYFWLGGAAADAAGTRHGFGSTALDVKWRAGEWNAWSVGLRGGVDLPTASDGLGIRQPGSHLLVMATYAAEPVMATTNIAYTHLPHDGRSPDLRRDIVRLSAGVLADVSEAVRLAGDLAVLRSPDSTERGWPGVGVIGFIAKLPWGFDVDAGYQFPLNRIAPPGQWLLGATVRW